MKAAESMVGDNNELEVLAGVVDRVTYHNAENGFCVLQVSTPGGRRPVTVVGRLPQVLAGEQIKARGNWVVDRDHGRQFKAEEMEAVPPDSVEGITRFLGSGLIHGIGPVYARKLVERFGRGVFEVIEKRSAELEKIDGIGPKRRRRIKESWEQAREVRAIMTFLMSHGVSTRRAFSIYRTYGNLALKQLQDDPYALTRDIRGIGFKGADRIALSLGFDRAGPERARAGVEYVLRELSNEGHCAYPREDLLARAVAVLEIEECIVEEALEHGMRSGRLRAHTAGNGTPLVFPADLYQAEVVLTGRLLRLARGTHPLPPIDIQKAVTWCQQRMGIELAAAQREAIAMACRSPVTIITGGPGVGKTTLVNGLLRILAAKRLRLVLCAPTGRAAKRLSEATGRPAATIHRLLAFEPGRGRFRHNESDPLKGDVFVVDEASMIDLPLAAALVRAIPPGAALVLVGDADQLPSVGPGMVLRDIIESDVFPVVRLTHVFRQAACSDIVRSAHLIHKGNMPLLDNDNRDSDFFFVEEEDPDKAAEKIVKLVSAAVPRRFNFDPVEDCQVLCPMRRGVLGSNYLNRVLQQRLNAADDRMERFGVEFRLGDKVMQLENDYDKDVFNGDIGRVTRLDHEFGELRVSFDGREVTFAVHELDELAPCYAITIHKSQGSEYPCVVIPVHTRHYIMLQRNLIYTAVTRGRQLVVLVGSRRAIAMAVKGDGSVRRITCLRKRLMSSEPA